VARSASGARPRRLLTPRRWRPARLAVTGDEVLHGEHDEGEDETRNSFRGRGLGILPMTAGGDGDLRGGRTRRRRSVPVEELAKARRNKPHHTVGVAWDLLTEEERRRVRLLPSAVENRGVSMQRSLGETGEGWGA
jgi:hypothetical protein